MNYDYFIICLQTLTSTHPHPLASHVHVRRDPRAVGAASFVTLTASSMQMTTFSCGSTWQRPQRQVMTGPVTLHGGVICTPIAWRPLWNMMHASFAERDMDIIARESHVRRGAWTRIRHEYQTKQTASGHWRNDQRMAILRHLETGFW